MTIQGAIAELQNLLDADDVPFYYKGGIEKVIETIQMEMADRKTEPSGYCNECKWYGDKQVCGRCRSRNLYAPKDEPQTETQTETQNSNLTFKTLEYCDICDHKGCEECIANALDEHCMPSQFNKQIEDECAKEYEELGLKELKELIEADRKTESSSEIPNICEHITEDGVTCAKYPACDDCPDNPLNKVKSSKRLVKGSEKPNNCEYAENPSGDVWECGCFLDTYCEHQIYDRNPDGTINIVKCGYEPKTEPTGYNLTPVEYVINPQEPTNDDKCFECDDFFTRTCVEERSE